jgi:hypothetical protein
MLDTYRFARARDCSLASPQTHAPGYMPTDKVCFAAQHYDTQWGPIGVHMQPDEARAAPVNLQRMNASEWSPSKPCLRLTACLQGVRPIEPGCYPGPAKEVNIPIRSNAVSSCTTSDLERWKVRLTCRTAQSRSILQVLWHRQFPFRKGSGQSRY